MKRASLSPHPDRQARSQRIQVDRGSHYTTLQLHRLLPNQGNPHERRLKLSAPQATHWAIWAQCHSTRCQHYCRQARPGGPSRAALGGVRTPGDLDPGRVVDVVLEHRRAVRLAQLHDRLGLDLADALARHLRVGIGFAESAPQPYDRSSPHAAVIDVVPVWDTRELTA